MNALNKLFSTIFASKKQYFFEINEGNYTRFITFDEWYRDRKENVFIDYNIGRIRDSNLLVRVHPLEMERKRP